jgi:acylphosphatase
MAELARIHIIAKGFVQGVGYRYFVMDAAHEHGLAGYARNREDGTVEVEAEGDASVLESFLEVLRVGPRGARVSGLDVERFPADKGFKEFTIRF